MKKICFFMESPFSLGGEQRVTVVLANYLSLKGYNVYFLLNCDENEYSNNYELAEGIEILYLKNRKKISYKIKSMFIKILKKINYKTGIFYRTLRVQKWFYSLNEKEIAFNINDNEFDYIIGVGSYFFSVLANIKDKISNTKIIAWQHSTFENYFRTPNTRLHRQELFIKELFKKIDYYVCQTNSDKEKIKASYNYTAIVINNPNTFSECFRNSLNNKNFVASGRFVKLKGFDKLVEAFYLFSQKNKDWNLYILGSGPEFNNIKKQIKKYSLESRIILPGRVDNVKEYYLKSSVCLITSAWEGWSMVATEAMQCGLPIVSFELPSLKEIFGRSYCGYLLNQGDIKEFAKVMGNIATSSELEIISNNCISRVKQFDVKNIGEKWENILQ